MAQGLERRAQPQDNLRGQEAINPVTRQVPSVGAPQAPRVPVDTYTAQIAQQVNQFASGRLAEIQQKRQERSMMDGQIAAMQGQSFESVEMEGDKWALEGYRLVTAQTLSSSLLRAQEAEIEAGAYEQDPDTYRGTLVNRIDAMVADIPDQRTRDLAREQLMQQMPGLVDAHMRRNIGFREQQNFDALAQSVDVLSRDNTSTGALIDFATGESGATAGLSIERRRAAVVQGIVNSFENNNPAAYAHLEAAGLLTTENLTASQLRTIRQAQAAYHTRMEQQWNAEWHTEMTDLQDRIATGDVDPLVAAEEYAAINARHNRRTQAQGAGQVYDAARAGVEFAEGTRGLNIQAAGVAGDYDLQARLMQAAVEHQESRGNPNAVSPVGATGVMQLMPATAMNPGFGVRDIFAHADSLGVAYSGRTEAEADRLMRNAAVNRQMGTEYLSAMLERYSGDVPRALAAYNWGAGRADNWDGDMASLPEETRTYIRNITGSWSDNRPDPEADRIAAERNLEQIRQQARLDVLEGMGPAMAENDELFMRGERTLTDWRATRGELYEQWGMALDDQRINQEQQMMRSVMGDRIQELQAVNDTEQAVALETSIAAADVQLQERRAAFEAGTSELTLDEINQEYMSNLIGAYEQSGTTFDPSRISGAASDLVTQSADLVQRALRAQEDRAIIANAETAQTVGTLEPRLRDRAVQGFRDFLGRQIENFRAANPQATPAEIGAMQRAAEVEYLANNGIVDPALQQQINLAASGNWIDQQGQARPSTVVGLQSFVGLMAVNPELAYQYVPEPEARGRMMAASHMVMSMFPDREVFTDVDLSNRNDPVANAFYDAVQQVGLSVGQRPSPEETAQRVARAVRLAERGNITNTWFGGALNGSAASALVPSSLLRAGLSGRFDMADVNAARSLDDTAINNQFNTQVTRFLEEVVPFMPATSQQGAVTMALDYVNNRGAVMGSSFVMPQPNEPGIRAQMFPGQQVENTAAVNTAIVEWMGSEEARAAVPQLADWYEDNAPGAEFLRRVSPFHTANPGTRSAPDFTVTRLNGQYVANIIGVGSIVLPLREIGDRYISTR